MSEYKSAKEYLEGMSWGEIREISGPAELLRSIESSSQYDATLEECEEALEEALEEAQRRYPLRSYDGRTAEEICGHWCVYQARAKESDIIDAYDDADPDALGFLSKLVSLGCQRAMEERRYITDSPRLVSRYVGED